MEEELKKELYEMQEKEWERELKKLKTYRDPKLRSIIFHSLYTLARRDPNKLEYLRDLIDRDVYIRDYDRMMLLGIIEKTKRELAEKKLEYVI